MLTRQKSRTRSKVHAHRLLVLCRAPGKNVHSIPRNSNDLADLKGVLVCPTSIQIAELDFTPAGAGFFDHNF